MKVSSLQSCLLSLDGTLPTFGEQVTNNQTSGSATEDSLTRSEAELRTTIERHPNAPTAQELCLFFCLFLCLFDVTSICSGKGGRSTTDPLPAQVDPTLAIVLLVGCFHCLLVFLLRWITPHYRSLIQLLCSGI